MRKAFFLSVLSAQPLLRQADSLFTQGKYLQADSLYQRLLESPGALALPDRERVVLTLGQIAYERGRYAEAIQRLSSLLTAESPETRLLAGGYLAKTYIAQAQNPTADSLLQRLLPQASFAQHPQAYLFVHRTASWLYLLPARESLLTQLLPLTHPYPREHTLTLLSLAETYYQSGKPNKGINLIQDKDTLLRQVWGERHPVYGQYLYLLGLLYDKAGSDHALVQELYKRALAIQAEAIGPDNPLYATYLYRLGTFLFVELHEYSTAESLLTQALSIQQRHLGKLNPSCAVTLTSLGALYTTLQAYQKAERAFEEALAIYERTAPPESPAYLTTLGQLAILYDLTSRYPEAEKLYKKILELRRKTFGPIHPSVAANLNNLGLLYHFLGQLDQAEETFRQAAEIWAQTGYANRSEHLRALHNLGLVLLNKGKHSEADSIIRLALGGIKITHGENSMEYSIKLLSLSESYFKSGRYTEAESLATKALEIQNRYGKSIHHVQSLIQNMRIKIDQNKYNEALTYAEELIREKAIIKENQKVMLNFLSLLFQLYKRIGQFSMADSLALEYLRYGWKFLHSMSLHLSSQEKYRLLENVLLSSLGSIVAYGIERQVDNPQLLETAYRIARSIKGYLLTTERSIKHLLAQNPDTATQNLYHRWRELREALVQAMLNEDPKTADSLYSLANETERTLLERLPQLQRYLANPLTEPTFPPLKPTEAAIEVFRLKEDTSLSYIYFILQYKKRQPYLQVALLSVSKHWENAALNAYHLSVSPGSPGTLTTPYEYLWKRVDTLLNPNIRRIYFAGDGIYYSVNLATLYHPHLQQLLGEKYEFIYLTSTRRLLETANEKPPKKSALRNAAIFGEPTYNTPPIPVEAPPRRSTLLSTFGGAIPPLPGARTEAEAIARLFHTKPFLDKEASEERLKNLQSPPILHIATHGYFSGGAPFNAMLHSGLLLAGAAVWDTLLPPADIEDGFLTAAEAATLNLSSTYLVTLSACNTGLGEPSPEGNFGIQRGFQEAGAQTVLASLWPVDDEATRDLMITFYRRLRRNPRRLSHAFATTLRRLKKSYPSPYYWGAFILIK